MNIKTCTRTVISSLDLVYGARPGVYVEILLKGTKDPLFVRDYRHHVTVTVGVGDTSRDTCYFLRAVGLANVSDNRLLPSS